jgi:PKD domain
MKNLFFIAVLVLSLCNQKAISQTPFRAYPFNNEYIWGLSIDSLTGGFDGSILSFDQPDLGFNENKYKRDSLANLFPISQFYFDRVYTALSDSFGQVSCWYSGYRLYNHNLWQEIPQNNLTTPTDWQTGGEARYGCSMLLPWPGAEHDKAIMIFNKLPWETLEGATVQFYTIWDETIGSRYKPISLNYYGIDLRGNNGIGSFIIDNQTIVADPKLGLVTLTPVRHANGRDWWIWYPQLQSKNYHKILINPEGVQYMGLFECDSIMIDNNENHKCAVSNDGTKMYKIQNTMNHCQIMEYDINRTTGDISFSRHWVIPFDLPLIQFNSVGSAYPIESIKDFEISPNGRYLYLRKHIVAVTYDENNNSHFDETIPVKFALFQMDLETAQTWNPEMTLIGYDAADAYSEMVPRLSFLAADNKIYYPGTDVCGTLGCGPYWLYSELGEGWFVINNPDRPYPDCNLGILTNVIATAPYISPNFRLGPVDGSAADTLGLDAWPIALFNCNPLGIYDIRFDDYSANNPDTWLWSFGDGYNSTEPSPDHNFGSEGTYNVCLTVTNEMGSDTECKPVQIGLKNNGNINLADEIQVFPNPFEKFVRINLPEGLPQGITFHMYGITGKQLGDWHLVNPGLTQITIGDLPSGNYPYELKLGRDVIKSGLLQTIR